MAFVRQRGRRTYRRDNYSLQVYSQQVRRCLSPGASHSLYSDGSRIAAACRGICKPFVRYHGKDRERLFDLICFRIWPINPASRLQREGKPSSDTKHRTCKYLNNIIEADRGALKRVIRPARGFQTMKTAAATMKGFEVMRMIRRGIASLVNRMSKTRCAS
jgi:hypothetical protein